MAKQLRYEVLITCNGKVAEHVLAKLKGDALDVKQQMDALAKAGEENSKGYQTLAKTYETLQGAINKAENGMKSIGQVMDNLAGSTTSDLRRAMSALKRAIDHTTDENPNRQKWIEQFNAVKEQVEKNTLQMAKFGTSWRSVLKNIDTASLNDLKAALQAANIELGQTPKNSPKILELRDAVAALSQQIKTDTEAVNGYSASWRSVYNNLQDASINDIKAALQSLEKEMNAMSGSDPRMERSRVIYAEMEEQIKKNTQGTIDWRKVLDDLDSASLKDMKMALTAANEELSKLPANDPNIKQVQTSIGELEKKIKDFETSSKYAGVNWRKTVQNLKGASTNELRAALAQLKEEMNGLGGDSPKLKTYKVRLKEIEDQIKENTNAIKENTDELDKNAGSWKEVAKGMGIYQLASRALDYVKDKIGDVVKGNLQLSDSMAAVRKVTGMTSDEVARLTTDLSKLDTRTTLEDLNAIAEAGGRMGLSKYGIQGMEQFVNAANQIQVALGDDLGDSIDESILPLAKLGENLGLFEKMGVEKSMLAIGSAINELGATSTAQGANIVDFSRRIQASAQLARLSTADILALGSAIDAAGITSEVGASSFSKFFASIRTNTTAIEKALNIPKGTIDELYNANRTMEATLLILDKMKERGGMRELGDIFKLLGSQGDRMTSTFAAMAKNVDILREHLRTSHEAFEEQVSITNEFNSVQETAQGYLDRANNLWSNAFVNPKGVDNVKAMAEQWYNLSKVLTESPVFMTQVKVALQALALAVKTLVVLAPFLVEFFMMKGAVQGVKYLMSLRDAFIVNKIALQGMTEAQLAANKAAKANVYIALAAALVTLGTYIYDYAAKANDAEKAQERLNNAVSEGAVEAQREVGHLNNVIKALDNAKLSQEGREKVIADFNQKYGQYISALGIEIKTVDDLRKNYDALAGAIRRAAYERVKDKFKEQELEPLIKASIEAGADLQKGGNAQTNAISVHDAEQAVSNFSKAIQTLTAKNLKKFRETYKQELQAIGLDPEKATVDQIKAKSTPADTRKIFNQSVQNGPRSLNEYLMNLIDKGEIKSAADAYKNIIMKEFSEGAKFGAEFDENLNYVVGQRVVNGVKVGTPVTKGTGAVGGEKSSAFNKKLYENVEKFVDAYLAVKNRGDEIDSAFDPYIRVPEVQGGNNIKPNKGSGGGTVDKEALKAAKKAAQERKKALKLEMDEAQKASTGIISKLEEYYRLQEAAINDARADGQLTEEQAKEMVRALSIVKNESLATARRAVTTGETKDWDELKTKVLPAVMSDTSEVSRNLLSTIQQVAVDKLHADLEKFNGSSDVLGLDSRAFFDQMNAKAAGNTREAARLRAKIQNEVERALMQYQFVEKANQQMRKDLEAMGITTETYEQWAKRMQQGITEKPATQLGMRTEQREQMYRSFEAYGEQTKGPKDAEGQYSTADKDVVQWVQQWSQQADNAWMKGLPQLDEWLSDTDKYEKQIADFYRTLLSMYEGYKKQMQQSGNEGADFLAFTQGQQQVSDATAQLDKMLGRSITDEQAYREMGNNFIQQGVINFRYNIENQQEAEQWLNDFATTSAGELEDWAQAFPELVEWINLIKRQEQGETLGEVELQALQNAMPQIKNLYNEMQNHADRVNKAMKQAYEHEKSQQDIRFQVAGYRKQEEETDKSWETVGKQKDAGIGQTLAEQIGVDKIADDPEIQRIQNRIYWRNQELLDAQAQFEQRKALNEQELQALRDRNATEAEIEALRLQQKQDNAGIEELIKEKQTQFLNETNNLAITVAQQMQKRVQAINTLIKPVTDFTQAAGRKIGDMIFNMESEEATWEQLWKNMALAVGESVIQMGAQYAQNLIMQQAMNKASEAEAVADAGVKVTAGIAAGSAKTIGELGWWGIPLIGVISALLMGLLQSALSTKSSKDGSSSSTSTAATPKTKLVSGMLTYDKGNVDKFAGRRKLYDDGETQVYGRRRYLGEDGKVYTATAEPAPKDGLVTHPIATTVQGQPALVAENGPEIVIGRETTKAIMMNEPELIKYLANYQQHGGRRLYDSGNTSDITVSRNNDIATSGTNDNADMRQALGEMREVMQGVLYYLQHPVRPKIDMYSHGGEDGLYDSMQKATKFMSRYGG